MAKQGQHNNDDRDQDKSRGHNNHEKSTPITTGTYKKHSTVEKQKAMHKPTNVIAQHGKNEWHHYTDPNFKDLAHKDTRTDEARSGSDSNADSQSRGY